MALGQAVTGRLAIGLGCRRDCAAETIVALVRDALARVAVADRPGPSPRRGEASQRPDEESRQASEESLIRSVGHLLPAGRGEGGSPRARGPAHGSPPRLFTLADKADEPGLQSAALDLGLDLVGLPRAALEGVMDRIGSPSPAAMAAVGLASVSEAAALAGAGAGGRLVLARIAAGGATCAIAEAEA